MTGFFLSVSTECSAPVLPCGYFEGKVGVCHSYLHFLVFGRDVRDCKEVKVVMSLTTSVYLMFPTEGMLHVTPTGSGSAPEVPSMGPSRGS